MISFIVPAYNEERLLAATLDALHAAARAVGEPYELVVVDDASTDRTQVIALRHGAVLVSVAHRQIAATRNSGARTAKGDSFIFVDADTIVNEAVVRSAVEALRGGAAGGGAAVEFDGTVPLYARLLMPVLVWSFRAAGLAAGCFLFCTRSAFAAVGGFNQNTPAQPGHVFQVTCTANCASFTWTNKSGNLPNIPVDSIIGNPLFPQQVFAGTDWGLYYTDDITQNPPTWFRFQAGLPNTMIWDMAIDRGNTALALFTRSRGAYAWVLPTGPVPVGLLGFEIN